MTCIVALKDKDGKTVWIAGDSAGVAGLSIRAREDRKVFLKQDLLGNHFGFGFTSSFRMGQLLQHKLTIPVLREGADVHAYMTTAFVEEVRTCLKAGGYAEINNNRERGGCFIVAVKGRIFEIESDFQVAESIHPYAAVGCGEDLALGSLYSSDIAEPEVRLTVALQAAATFSAGVREPFHTIQVSGDRQPPKEGGD